MPSRSVSSRPTGPGRGAFLGRGPELGRLAALRQESIAARGRVVVLVGPAGIGKTRLVEEFLADSAVLSGHAGEQVAAPPFWPWIEALRPAAGGAADLDGVLGLPPDAAAGPDRLGAERARFRLFDGVAQHLRRLSARRPVLLVLEDIGAADPSSLRLLRFVCPRIAAMRALIVATSRDLGVADPNHELFNDLLGEPNCETLFVRPLAEDDVRELLDSVLGAPAPAALVERLLAKTDGNPLYLHEATRALTDPGVEDRLAEWVPPSFRHEIDRRLAGLSGEARALVTAGAVLGRSFDPRAAAAIADGLPVSALDAVGGLVEAGILEYDPSRPGLVRFRHDLIHDVVYLGCPYARRSRLHGQAGEYLEVAAGGVAESTVARHYVLGAPALGDDEAVWRHLLRAGDFSLAAHAYEDAARLFETGLQFAAGPSALTTLLRTGLAYTRSGDAAKGRQCYWRAASAAQRLGDPVALAEAALGYADTPEYGALSPALVGLLQSALAELPGTEERLRALVTAALAAALYWADPQTALGDPGHRRALAGEALALAQATQDHQIYAAAAASAYLSSWGPDNLDERERLVDEIAQRSRARNDERPLLQAHGWRMIDALERGDVHGADIALSEYVRLAEDSRQPSAVFWAFLWRSMRALMRGDHALSDRLRAEAERLGEHCQDRTMFTNACYSQYAMVCLI